jgi:hypothetical protein
MTEKKNIPEALRGKAVDDPEVLLWQSDRLLAEACAVLDRCFNELGYDEEQIEELLSGDLFDEWEAWRERHAR